MHRQLHPVTHCASCGAKPKHGHFIRHSPDATKVSAYLSGTSEDKVIQPQDYLCYTCYKLHLSILTSLEAEPKNSNEHLRANMDIWRVKYNDENTDVLTRAILHVVLVVSDHLLLEKAILLPQACKLFLDSYGVSHTSSIKSVDLDLDVGDSIIKFSSRWVLNQLMLYLNPYMECRSI